MLHAAGDGECGQLRLYQRSSLERLLVAGARGSLAPASSEVSGEAEPISVEAALVAEPPERFECALGGVGPSERVGARQQGLRQTCVVVAEPVLEPVPVVGGLAFEGVVELLDQALEQSMRRGRESIRVHAREPEHRIRSRA